MTQVSNYIEKQIGPVSYTVDEYRFWHRFKIGKWELAIRLDRENETPRFPLFSVLHLSETKDGFPKDYLSGINATFTHTTPFGSSVSFETAWWNRT